MVQKKKISKKAAQGSISEEQLMKCAEMAAHQGEKLGGAILALFMVQGSDYDALVTETYALAKAWSALQVISKKLGVDMTELFDSLLPSFQRDMQELLESEED